MEQAWLIATVVGLMALHLLVVLSALRARRTEPARTVDRTASGVGVRCPDCEAENEPGYRFCRQCVTELPGRAARGDGASSPASRRPT